MSKRSSALFLCLCLSYGSAFGQSIWTGAAGDGLWSNPGNWTPPAAEAPGVGGQVGVAVVIDLIGSYTVTLDVDVTLATLVVGGISGSQELIVDGADLDTSGIDTLNANGTVSFINGANYLAGIRRGSERGTIAMNVAGTLIVEDSNIGKDISVSGEAFARGTSAFTGFVSVTGPGELTAEGTASGPADISFQNTLNNTGSVVLTSDVANQDVTVTIPGAAMVNNFGTITSSGSEGQRRIDAQVANSGGTIQVDYPLTITKNMGAQTNDNTIIINDTTLTYELANGSFSMGSTGQVDVQGNGLFELRNGSFTADGMIMSTVRAPGATAAYEDLTISGLLSADIISIFRNCSFDMFASLTVNNEAIFQGTNNLDFSVGVTNNGTVRVQGESGTKAELIFNAGWMNGGDVRLDSLDGSDAELRLSGTLTNMGTIVSEDPLAQGGLRQISAALDNAVGGMITTDYPLHLDQIDASHLNQGTIRVNAGDFIVVQSGTGPTFDNMGTIDIPPDGGAFHVIGGNYAASADFIDTTAGGASSVPQVILEGATLASATLMNNLTLYLIDATVDGDASIDNRAITKIYGVVNIDGQLTNNQPGAEVLIVADDTHGDGHLRLNGSYDNGNGGTIEMTSLSSTFNAVLEDTDSDFFNGSGGILSVTAGSGGGRRLISGLSNDGTVTVDHDFELDAGAGVEHANNDNIDINTGRLSVNNATASDGFLNDGTITIDPGSSLAINGGYLDNMMGTVSNGVPSPVRAPDGSRGPVMIGLEEGLVLQNASLVNPLTNNGLLWLIESTVAGSLTNDATVIALGNNDVTGSLANNAAGTVWIDGDPVYGDSQLDFQVAAANDGNIKLSSSDGAATSVLSSSMTFTNNGMIESVGTSGQTRRIEAELNNTGSILVMEPLELSGAGLAHVNNGSITVSSGPLQMDLSGSAALTNNGTISVAPGQVAEIFGGTFSPASGDIDDGGMTRGPLLGLIVMENLDVISGILSIPATMAAEMNGVTFQASADLDNAGDLELYGTNSFMGSATNGAGGSIHLIADGIVGDSSVAMTNGLTNSGQFILDTLVSAHESTYTGGAITNQMTGTLRAQGVTTSPDHLVQATLSNAGQVAIDHGLVIEAPDPTHLNDPGTISINAGTLTIRDTNGAAPVGSLQNLGDIQIASGATLTMDGTELANSNMSLIQFGTVSGNGAVDVTAGSFTNNGMIQPGDPNGILNVMGDLAFGPDGILAIEIGGYTIGTDYDRLAVTGNLSLDGSLDLSFTNGFEPLVDDIFTIATYTGTLTGDFGTFSGLDASNGVFMEPSIGAGVYDLTGTSTDIFWTGAVDNDFNNPGNWNPSVAPSDSTSVFIDLPGTYQINLTSSVDLLSLTLGTTGGTGTQTLDTDGFDLNLFGPLVIEEDGHLLVADSLITDGFLIMTREGEKEGSSRGLVFDLDNAGLLEVTGISGITPFLLNQTGATLRVTADTTTPGSELVLENGMTNNGTVELDSVVAGPSRLTSFTLLENFGTFHCRFGAGGDRTIDAAIDNQGLMVIDADTTTGAGGLPLKASAKRFLATDEGTLARYDFEGEDPLVQDDSINGLHLSLEGGARVDAVFGKALSIGSEGNGLSLEMLAEVLADRETWTLEYLIQSGNVTEGTSTVVLSDGALTRSEVVLDDLWHYQAVTWDGAVLNIWRDGELVDSSTQPFDFSLRGPAPRLFVDAAGNAEAVGLIDELAVRDHALGETEIAARWRALRVINPSEPDPEIALETIVGLTINGRPAKVANRRDDRLILTDRTDAPVERVGYVTHGGERGTLTGFQAMRGKSGELIIVGGERAVLGTGFTNADVLTLNGAAFTVASGSLSNELSAVLQGSGTIDVTATSFDNAGFLIPGASPGLLAIEGDATFQSTASVVLEIGGNTVSKDRDQLTISGTVDLAGQLDVVLTNGFTGTHGDVVDLITYGAANGDFDTVVLPPDLNGFLYSASKNPTAYDMLIETAGPFTGTQIFPVDGPGSRLYGIDAETGTVTASATVGSGATAPFLSPIGDIVYVPNGTDGTITKVETSTKLVLGTITGLNAPMNGAVTPDNGQIWVTDSVAARGSSASITVLDRASENVLDQLSPACLSGFPVAILHNASNGLSYVVGAGGSVCVFDTATRALSTSFNLSGPAVDAVLASNGSVLYASSTTGVLAVDTLNNSETLFSLTGTPGRLDITDGGDTLFVITDTNTVTAVETAAGTPNPITIPGATALFDVVAVTGVDTVWLTEPTPGGLLYPVTISSQTPGTPITGPAGAELSYVIANKDFAPSNGTFQFSLSNYPVREDDGQVTIEVDRIGGSTGTVDIQYQTLAGSAQSPGDYIDSFGTLTFMPGQTTNSFTVDLADDRLVEGPESFSVEISAGVVAERGAALDVATVSIEDWEEGSFAFQTGLVTTDEDSTAVAATILRNNGADGNASVTVDLLAGDATQGLDFTFTSQTASFADGQTMQTISIPILDDSDVEGQEFFELGLTSATDNAVIDPLADTFEVRINDVEPGELVFSTAIYSVAENAGNAVIGIDRINGSSGLLEITFQTSDGTATSPDDYTATTTNVSFADGVTFQQVTVPIIDDGDLEDPVETVNLALFTGTRGSGQTAILEIVDDEMPPQPGEISFTSASYGVVEGQNAVVSLQRTGGSDGSLTVELETLPGDATAGQDYVYTLTSITFADGQVGPIPVTIATVDDGTYESPESFQVEIREPGGKRAVGTPSTATVTITDDQPPPDPGVLSFVLDRVNAQETDSFARLSVRRQAGTGGEITVRVVTNDDTATAGSDYDPIDTILTFADGDSTTQTVEIPLRDDLEAEAPETFTVELRDPTNGATVGSPSLARVSIIDDDRRTVRWQTSSATRVESGMSLTLQAELDAPTDAESRVSVGASGTATRGTEYTLSTTELVFPAGATTASLEIVLIDDIRVESDEVVMLDLFGGNTRIGNPSRFLLTITDDDEALVNWTAVPARVREGGPESAKADTVITIAAGLNQTLGEPVTVPFTVTGSATRGEDHDLADGTLAFAAGDVISEISFTLFDDEVDERDETIVLTLGDGEGTLPGESAQAVIEIRDDDTAVISWVGAETEVVEDDTFKRAIVQTVRATLSNPLDRDLEVRYNVGGTAKLGTDHDLERGTLVFPAGLTVRDLTFLVLGDVIRERNEYIVLDLLTGRERAGANRRHVVTIIDNDDDAPFPEAEITEPSELLVRTGSTLDHAGTVISGPSEGIDWLWEICPTGGGPCFTSTEQTFALTYDQPGFYVITCIAAKDGNEDLTPAVRRLRVVDNPVPRARISDPPARVIDVAAGETRTFTGEAVDPESPATKEGLDLAWFFQSDPENQTTGSLQFTTTFGEPGTYNLVFAATDAEGATGSDNIIVNVYDAMPPLRAEIIVPANDSSFAVGEVVQFEGAVVNTASAKAGLDLLWSFGDGNTGSGEMPTHTYQEPGLYRVRFLVRDMGDTYRLEASTTVNIRDNAPPRIDFSFPTDLVLTPDGTGKNEGMGDSFLSAIVTDTRGYRDLSFFWELDTGDGNSQRFTETPGRLFFEEGQDYTISVSALTPDGVQSNVAVRTISVRNTVDEDFEPNDTVEDAPLITPGEYDNLSLDGDKDLFQIEITEPGQRLVFETETSGNMLVDIIDEDGVALIQDRLISGSGNVQVPELMPGVYTICLEEQPGPNKAGLSFGFNVSVLAPALFFPDIRVDSQADSQIGVVNPTGDEASVEVIGYDREGNIIDEIPFKLPPMARNHLTIGELFGDNAGDVAWAQVDATTTVFGYARTEGRDDQEVYAFSANEKLSSELYVPHIAERTDQWFTRASVINGSDQTSDSVIDTPGATDRAVLDLAKGFGQDSFDFLTRFGGAIDPDTEDWAAFRETGDKPSLAGVEIFGTLDGSRVAAGLALADARRDNPNFTYVANNLYFTHIARSSDFYTGIALVNLGAFEQGVRVTAYGVEGQVIGQRIRTMRPNEKIVEIADQFLEGIGTPAEVDWVQVEADQDVVGFELFGTTEPATLAGLEASTGLTRELCFPFIDTDTAVAHGLSVVNVNNVETEVEFNLLDNEGQVVAGPVTYNLLPNQKLISTIPDLFGPEELTGNEIPGWLAVSASNPVAGFELFINTANGQQMGALIAR